MTYYAVAVKLVNVIKQYHQQNKMSNLNLTNMKPNFIIYLLIIEMIKENTTKA